MQDGAAPSVARTKVTVDLGARSYDILIGRDVLANAGAELAARFPGARFAVVTDDNSASFSRNVPTVYATSSPTGRQST